MTYNDIDAIMEMIAYAGDSCDTCMYCDIANGDCPFEPYNHYDKPVMNNVTLCHRHSAGPAPGTGGTGKPGRREANNNTGGKNNGA